MRSLKLELDRKGILTRTVVSAGGRMSGGVKFSRGALYRILGNRIYLGEIVHKGTIYAGEHEAILDREVWESVQERLRSNNDGRKRGIKAKESSLLAGWVFDGDGRRLIPTHTTKKGKRYRYYIAWPAIDETGNQPKVTVPAHDLESTILGALTHWLRDVPTLLADLHLKRRSAAVQEAILANARSLAKSMEEAEPKALRGMLMPIMEKIIVGSDQITVELRRTGINEVLNIGTTSANVGTAKTDKAVVLKIQASMQRGGLEMRLVVNEEWGKVETVSHDWALIKAVARAHIWMEKLVSGEIASIMVLAKQENMTDVYVRRILRCATLAPDIVEAILEGRQPADITLTRLTTNQPMLWAEQRTKFGMGIAP
ncbi:recombinase family protein [Georgfuchsia toluolica]|uniref:recombinase family protein n=1 Tax=Georgfuchsia toluolica TaxID=424218 RepID=UPI001FE95511|nr:recombinase family protein [Georgfuchsia toluolica]